MFQLGEIAPMPGHRPCWRKQAWRSQGAAEAQLRSLLARGLAYDPARIHVYLCSYGRDHWHVGHIPTPKVGGEYA